MKSSRKTSAPEDIKPQWFVVQSDRWVGPLTEDEILEKIEAGEFTWAHFAHKEGTQGFKRICDLPEFKSSVPSEPGSALMKRPPTKPPKSGKSSPKIWFLYYNDSQFGPFAREEISRFLQIGKIHRRVHAWKDGMDEWERIEAIADFEDLMEEVQEPQGETALTKIREQRGAPRRPLVARIFVVKDESVIVAVCRDISVGGMQVLTDRIPGTVGTRLKMNVSPSGGELGGQIRPFVAEGVIVRVLEENRGFSFRFESLPNEAKRAIENYIASTD